MQSHTNPARLYAEAQRVIPSNGCIYDVHSGRLSPVPLDGPDGAGGLTPLPALPRLPTP